MSWSISKAGVNPDIAKDELGGVARHYFATNEIAPEGESQHQVAVAIEAAAAIVSSKAVGPRGKVNVYLSGHAVAGHEGEGEEIHITVQQG
jgi:hypothetical protein